MSSRGLAFVIVSALLTVAANLMLRAGIDKAGGFSAHLQSFFRATIKLIAQPLFDAGVFLYAIAILLWFNVISTEPLSVAYPLLVSLTFIFVTLGAVVLFGETLSMMRFIGIIIILIGITILSGGKLL